MPIDSGMIGQIFNFFFVRWLVLAYQFVRACEPAVVRGAVFIMMIRLLENSIIIIKQV